MSESQGQPSPNLMDHAFIANPYPALNALREADGVGTDSFGAQWFVTRYDDVHRILYDRALSADPANADAGTSMGFIHAATGGHREGPQSILMMDEPGHTRLRKLVNKAFTPRAVESVRPRAEAIADELLDAIGPAPEFDLMSAFAQPYPTTVIAEMIGVDPADRARFKAWSDLSVGGLDPFLTPEERARSAEGARALHEYFGKAIAGRVGVPGDDLVSRLIAAREENDALTTAEIVVMLSLLLTAGNVTTTDLIGNGVKALLEHPAELQRLRADPALIPNAVEEILRFDPPVIETWRTSDQPIEVCAHAIAARQTIAPSLAAANHDPRHFPDPERFDVGRTEVDHLSFGGGIHYCLGASLARLEAQVALAKILQRFPNLRASETREPVYRALPGFRGMESYWVRTD